MSVSSQQELSELTDYDYQFDDHENPDKSRWPILKSKFSNLLYFSAGADPQILQACPHSDRVKEQCIGMMVLATATLAFFSGSFAFYTVFSPKETDPVRALTEPVHTGALILSILFGLFWASMIFNLDRFIVSSTGHGDGTDKITLGEFGRALPRIFMAIMIGFVLSKPLEIRIMANEIAVQLAEDNEKWVNQQVPKFRQGIDEEVARINSELGEVNKRRLELTNLEAAAKSEVDKWTKEAAAEADGTGGTKKAELGKIYNLKNSNKEKAQKDYDELVAKNAEEVKSLKARADDLLKNRDDLNSRKLKIREDLQKQSYKNNGIWARIQAATHISEIASWALTFLLIMLEIAPILIKMMLTLTPYEYLQENARLKTLALRGIDLQQDLDTVKNKDNIELSDSKYFEVDVLKENQIGKLKIEEELARVAQTSFLQSVKEDIEKHPSKYIRHKAVDEIAKK